MASTRRHIFAPVATRCRGVALVYQLVLLHRQEHGADLRLGLKAFLEAA
jgi:hypothetical protein